MGFFVRKRPRVLPRRYRDMRRSCKTWAISHFGPLTRPILRAPVGTRAGAVETNQGGAVAITGPKQDLGTLNCHY